MFSNKNIFFLACNKHFTNYKECAVVVNEVLAPGGVPILRKVTKIGLQIFVTCAFYIFVTFNQYSLVGQVFCNCFEPIFRRTLVK
jgi:hypothetical protein